MNNTTHNEQMADVVELGEKTLPAKEINTPEDLIEAADKALYHVKENEKIRSLFLVIFNDFGVIKK